MYLPLAGVAKSTMIIPLPMLINIPMFDTVAAVIYPWFMVLLFVVSGMSAKYSLEKRTGRQFIKERAVKLLIPSTLGLFVIHWITDPLFFCRQGKTA